MHKREAIELRLCEPGDGRKLCPYVGTLMVPYVGTLTENILPDQDPDPAYLYARSASLRQSYHNHETELRDGNGHLLTIAPTRAGKGTGQIILNLLTWRGSVLVVDIKGENYSLSAGYRKNKLGQKIIRFAPFEKESEIWNPIMSIRSKPGTESTPEERYEEEEDARYLTNLLIAPTGNSRDAFWENSAKNFNAACVKSDGCFP
ncbi:MAG: type IV secretory system conjugative DNA transfer family protein [Methylomicrobium sp.]